MKKYNVTVNGVLYEVEVEEVGGAYSAPVAAAPAAAPVAAPAAAPAPAAVPAGGTKVEAPMPGTVLKVAVSAGTAVKKGDLLLVLEAMKMENEISAPCDGTVSAVPATAGASVNAGDALVVIA